MPSLKTLRKNMQSHINSAGEHQGRTNFVEEVLEGVGLRKRATPGDYSSPLIESYNEETGNREIATGSHSAQEYSFRDLALVLGGQQFLESMEPGEGPSPMELMEAGPGIDPTTFVNTNLFTAAVGGLVDAKVLEGFNEGKHTGDQLFQTIPTNKNGEKMPGTHGFQEDDGSTERKPGQPHPRGTIGERWVDTPELTENALACEVTKEAVFYDLTGQVLAEAGQVGNSLRRGKEKRLCDAFIGASNSYNYKGTAYNTYQASTPWINTQTNVAEDDSDIDAALDLFLAMTDPETGVEIEVEPTTIAYYQGERSKWHRILNSQEIREVTNSNRTTIATPPPSVSSNYTLVEWGQVWHNRIVSQLSESAADAREYWFIGEPQRCFKWMEAWPIQVKQANPSEYAMLDRGLVAAYFANYRGVPAVIEPRYVVRNIAAS